MRKTTVTAALALTVLGIAAAQISGASPIGIAVGQLTTPSQSQAPNQPQAPLPPAATPISAQQRDATIDVAADLVEASYVEIDLAKRMAADLRQRKSRGEYADILTGQALASALLSHLKAIYNDKHMRLVFNSGGVPQGTPQPNAVPSTPQNYGFVKAEVLDGNVGYLRVDAFAPPQLSRATMAAAMSDLAKVDAITLDLRANTGGSPAAVALLASYFFNHRVHLNDIYNRPSNTTVSYYTDPQAAAVKLPTQKVYLLTSAKTFSAGEGFAYNLQALKRGVVIGEVTGGGTHPTVHIPVTGNLVMALPTSKPVNPTTKTNWEGMGVQPDVKIGAARALYTARVMALENLIAITSDPVRRASLQQALTSAQASPQEDK